MGDDNRCYIRPLDAHYIGEECVTFNEIDADHSGGEPGRHTESCGHAVEFRAAALDQERQERADRGACQLPTCARLLYPGQLERPGLAIPWPYVASMVGSGLPDSCGEEFMLEADNNKDGQVDFNEFMNWRNTIPGRQSEPRAPLRSLMVGGEGGLLAHHH